MHYRNVSMFKGLCYWLFALNPKPLSGVGRTCMRYPHLQLKLPDRLGVTCPKGSRAQTL